MPYKLIHYCGECSLRANLSDGRLGCSIYLTVMSPTDFCSKYEKDAAICELCGKPIPKNHVVIVDNNHVAHDKCIEQSYSCSYCTHITTQCSFETDPSSLPKHVVQKVRNGNMIIQQQVKNPERIKVTCANGCPCYASASQECSRQNGVCQSLQVRWN